MGPGNGNHPGGVKALADAHLDLHGVGGAFAVLAVQHGLLFIVENHILLPFITDSLVFVWYWFKPEDCKSGGKKLFRKRSYLPQQFQPGVGGDHIQQVLRDLYLLHVKGVADFDNLQEVLILTDLKNSDEAVE